MPRLTAAKTRNRMKRTGVMLHPLVSFLAQCRLQGVMKPAAPVPVPGFMFPVRAPKTADCELQTSRSGRTDAAERVRTES